MIILLNGPPSSGKDTIAKGFMELDPRFKLEKFAYPIKAACATFYGLTKQEWDAIDNDPIAKNEPREEFFGKSCREVQIAFSEQFVKPVHGEETFGELCKRRIIKSGHTYFIISDSGFEQEAKVLLKEFGPQEIVLVNLHREGCTFEGDSRGYIDLPCLPRKTKWRIDNSDSISEAVEALIHIVKSTEGT